MSAEDTSKLEDSSQVVKDLVSVLRSMFARGMEPSYKSLKTAAPNHSPRDYSAALKLFREERLLADKWSDTAPPEIMEGARLIAAQAWAMASEHFSKQLEEARLAFNLEVDECRAARQASEERVLALEAELGKFRTELDSLRVEKAELERINAGLESGQTERDAAIDKLQAEKKLLEGQIDTLVGVLKKLKPSNGPDKGADSKTEDQGTGFSSKDSAEEESDLAG